MPTPFLILALGCTPNPSAACGPGTVDQDGVCMPDVADDNQLTSPGPTGAADPGGTQPGGADPSTAGPGCHITKHVVWDDGYTFDEVLDFDDEGRLLLKEISWSDGWSCTLTQTFDVHGEPTSETDVCTGTDGYYESEAVFWSHTYVDELLIRSDVYYYEVYRWDGYEYTYDYAPDAHTYQYEDGRRVREDIDDGSDGHLDRWTTWTYAPGYEEETRFYADDPGPDRRYERHFDRDLLMSMDAFMADYYSGALEPRWSEAWSYDDQGHPVRWEEHDDYGELDRSWDRENTYADGKLVAAVLHDEWDSGWTTETMSFACPEDAEVPLFP